MPTIMPSTIPMGASQYGKNAAERAVLRIVSPMQVGVTLYRVDGVWHQKRTPAQIELAPADMVLLGGHEYDVTAGIIGQIEDAGFSVIVIDQGDTTQQWQTASGDVWLTAGYEPYELETA